MNGNLFQGILDIITPYLPNGFEKVVGYLEYGKASYSFAFYAKVEGEYVKCYDWPGFTEDISWKVFDKIDKLVSEERKNSIDSSWTNMTIVVGKDGSFHSDYDYTDLSDCAYAYKKAWRQKYLV